MVYRVKRTLVKTVLLVFRIDFSVCCSDFSAIFTSILLLFWGFDFLIRSFLSFLFFVAVAGGKAEHWTAFERTAKLKRARTSLDLLLLLPVRKKARIENYYRQGILALNWQQNGIGSYYTLTQCSSKKKKSELHLADGLPWPLQNAKMLGVLFFESFYL